MAGPPSASPVSDVSFTYVKASLCPGGFWWKAKTAIWGAKMVTDLDVSWKKKLRRVQIPKFYTEVLVVKCTFNQIQLGHGLFKAKLR